MAVPKRRTSRAKKLSRRAHDFLTPPNWLACSNCGDRMIRHRACPACGHYRGREVVRTVED